MSWSMHQITEEMARRRLAQDPILQRMMEVRDRNNGDVVVPVPQVDDDIPLSSLAPLLIADAIEQPAIYAAQQPPTVLCPALDPGPRSLDYASRKRKAIYAAWDNSWWDLFTGRMYRHLAAYATSALVVSYDFKRETPLMTLRDPLSAYPEPIAPEDFTLPCNVGFVRSVSLDYLHATWPETQMKYPKGSAFAVSSAGEGEMYDLVEWFDDDECVIGVLGPRDLFNSWTADPIRYCMELARYPNPMGRCPAVIPRKVTLDRIISQLSNLTGHADLMAKLIYLDIRATESSVMPARYVLAKTGQNPRLVDGEWHDGETGLVNLVVDADAIGELRGTPDPNNKSTIDRTERNFRVSSGLIPQTGGETYGALRTGRGIDSLMGAALDPKTAEVHHVAERYLGVANELILLAYLKYRPSRTFYVGSPQDPTSVEFEPSKHIQDRAGEPYLENKVRYPMPGMDDITSTQVIGQMLGAEMISAAHARRLHPHVPDPEGVERQILVETFERLSLAGLGKAAEMGTIAPEDYGRMVELAYEGYRLHEIIAKVNEEASSRQAAAPPEPQPGQLAPPEAMPGLAQAGVAGAEMGQQGTGGISPPPSGVQNLQALAQAFKQPARTA